MSATTARTGGRFWRSLGASITLLAAVVLISLYTSKYSVAPHDILHVVAAKLTDASTSLDPTIDTVIWQVRLPRVLAAILVGASLAAAGAVYQGLSCNPLVSPDILGVSAGASLGAVGGIFLEAGQLLSATSSTELLEPFPDGMLISHWRALSLAFRHRDITGPAAGGKQSSQGHIEDGGEEQPD